MSWHHVTLENIASINGGKRLPKDHDFSSSKTNHPYIRARDIREGRIDITEPVYITDQTASLLKKYVVKRDDVVITIVGANIGDIGFISEELEGANLTENAARIRAQNDKCHSKFLSLHLSMPKNKERFKFIASGSAQGKLGLYKIKAFEVVLPPLAIQEYIADILSAYDDLIENNRRRIQLLEESARLLYREWFVHLRFPGHEHVRVIDDVPEGWSIARLTSLANVVDGTHDSPKPASEGYYMVTGKHITNGFIDFSKCYFISSKDHRQVMRRSQPEKGDVIFSNIGTLGSAVLVDQDFEFSIKNVALFKPLKSVYSIYLYTFFSDPRTLNILQGKSSGTSQKFFSLKFLRSIEVLIPPSSILEYFHDVANPLFAQRSLLCREILKLQKARDLLLPRLMNGEITV